MSNNPEQHTEDFIIIICRHVNGVGPAKAGAIAADFSANLVEFLKADGARFHAIKNSRGKSYLSDDQIDSLLEIIRPFENFTDIRETWIFYIGRQFLFNVVGRLRELNLTNLDINPFLSIALELKDPEQILTSSLKIGQI